jgi:hypothetical protein
MSINSYSSIYTLGHRAVLEIFSFPTVVEEKVDGSQFSFGKLNGELHFRSKGAKIHDGNVPKLFQPAVNAVLAIQDKLVDGWKYRGETLASPRHNTLAYDRVPANNIAIFDIDRGNEDYLDPGEKATEAQRLGFEVAPLLAQWAPGEATPEKCQALLGLMSFLGSQHIEGFVVKCYGQFGLDKKTLMAKYVSEGFKEVHNRTWKADGDKGDILEQLTLAYKTEARWNKAIAHLAERGLLTNTPRDIGPLMKEVAEDVKRECEAEIKEKLFAWGWKVLGRKVAGGLPEFYKERLLKAQFSGDGNSEGPEIQDCGAPAPEVAAESGEPRA